MIGFASRICCSIHECWPLTAARNCSISFVLSVLPAPDSPLTHTYQMWTLFKFSDIFTHLYFHNRQHWTASSLLTPVSDNCVLPTLEHSLSVGCAAVLETGPLPMQDHKSGTVCRPISDYVGCHTASSGGYWRHCYSDSEATAQCELFLTAQHRNILTYLFSWLTVNTSSVPLLNKSNGCQL